MLSAEQLNLMSQWRAKAVARTLTPEELREAILLLRQSRRSAVEASRKSKSAAPKRDAEDLLKDL